MNWYFSSGSRRTEDEEASRLEDEQQEASSFLEGKDAIKTDTLTCWEGKDQTGTQFTGQKCIPGKSCKHKGWGIKIPTPAKAGPINHAQTSFLEESVGAV